MGVVALSCQKWNGQKMAPHTTFSRKKWNGVPVLAAKNGTPLPKMELLFILKKVPALAVQLLFTMTTQFEAKEFLIFTFLTSAQQQNHSSYLLTSSLTYMKPHSTRVIATF